MRRTNRVFAARLFAAALISVVSVYGHIYASERTAEMHESIRKGIAVSRDVLINVPAGHRKAAEDALTAGMDYICREYPGRDIGIISLSCLSGGAYMLVFAADGQEERIGIFQDRDGFRIEVFRQRESERHIPRLITEAAVNRKTKEGGG